MALFVPVIIGLPIGYFTWATVFDTVDSKISQLVSKDTTCKFLGQCRNDILFC